MTCLKRFTKGAALFEQFTRSGSMATSPSLNRPVYVFTDVPSAVDQALGRGQSMHRLHNATVQLYLILLLLRPFAWQMTLQPLSWVKSGLD